MPFSLRSSLLCAGLLAVACPETPSGPGLSIVGLEPGPRAMRVGQPLVLEVEYRDASGELIEPFEVVETGTLLVPSSGPAPLTSTFTSVEPGRRRYQLVASRYAQLFYGQRARRCGTCEFVESPQWVLLEAEPSPQQLVPFDAPTTVLAVGEGRVLSGFSIGEASTNVGQQSWSLGVPITLSSSAPNVARIDGARVVGVAEGTATITLSTSAATGPPVTATVRLEVVSTPLAPPEEGHRPLFPVEMDSNEGGDRWRQPHLASQLALDRRGWPVAVGTPFGSIAGASVNERPALLSQWTGTGFETLPLGRPGEEVVSPHLAVDARDVRYVVYRNTAEIRFPTRTPSPVTLATLAPGEAAYSLRTLPLGAAPDALAPPDSAEASTLSTSTLAIAPRDGGGAWVAWLFLLKGADTCEARLRLAEVFPDGRLEAQDVARFRRMFFASCDADALFPRIEDDSRTVVFDLTRRPGATPDLVLEVGRDAERPWSGRYALVDGQWTRTEFFTAADLRAYDLPFGPFALFPPRAAVEGSTPGWTWWGPPTSEQRDWMPWRVGDGPAALLRQPAAEPVIGRGEPYAVQLGSRTWLGNEDPLLVRISSSAGAVYDDPTPRWFEGSNGGRTFQTERRQWLVQGVEAQAGRIHMALARGTRVEHAVADVPRLATGTTPEAEGRLLDQGGSAHRFLSTPSGRWLLASRTPMGARLGFEATPDQPWRFASLPERDVDWLPAIGEHAGRVYAFTQPFTGAGLTVLVSTDQGVTFTVARRLTMQTRVTKVVVHANVVFVHGVPMRGAAELLRLDLADATLTPTNLVGTMQTMGIDETSTLVDASAGVAVFVRTGAQTLRLFRWSDTGALAEEVTLTGQPTDPTLDLARALIEADGRMTVRFGNTILRRDAGQSTFRALGDLGPLWYASAANPVRVGPRRLAIPLTVRTLRDCWQLALRISDDDGATWRTSPVLRATGGCNQTVLQASVAGAFLDVELSDSFGLRGHEVGDDLRVENGISFPVPLPLVQRLPVP